MRPLKALWNALEVMFVSMSSGLVGAQIALYLTEQKFSVWLIIGSVIILGVVLFLVYIFAPDDLAK